MQDKIFIGLKKLNKELTGLAKELCAFNNNTYIPMSEAVKMFQKGKNIEVPKWVETAFGEMQTGMAQGTDSDKTARDVREAINYLKPLPGLTPKRP